MLVAACAATNVSLAAASSDEAHSDPLLAPTWEAVPLEDGARVERYLGDHTALVAHGAGGSRGLMESLHPLRTRGADGQLEPVDLELADRGEHFAPRVPLVPVRIEKDPRAGVSFVESGIAFTPIGFWSAAARRVAGKASWANAAQDTDYWVMPTPGGVETFAELRSEQSPDSLAWRFELPAGAALRLPHGPRGPALIERDGEALARISPPVAWDADGDAVSTSYHVAGSVLRMAVEHRAAGVRHPVVADPEIADSSLDANPGGWRPVENVPGLPAGAMGLSPFFIQPGGGFTWNGGEWGDWRYTAPGSAYVYNLHFSGVTHQRSGSSMVQGIMRPDGSWEAGYWNRNGNEANGIEPMTETSSSAGNTYQHCTQGLCQPGIGSSGNMAVFRAQITSPGYRCCHSLYQSFSGTSVYLDDREAPVAGAPSHGSPAPGAWVDSASYSVTAPVSDGTAALRGLGAKKLELRLPKRTGGTSVRSATHPCAGGHNDRCPQTWTPASLSYSTADLPEGASTATLHGYDVLGKESAARTWQVKVDRSAPEATATGDGWTPVAGMVPPGERSIAVSATDAYAGVKSVEIEVDGVREFNSTQTCAAGGCSMSRTWTYDTADYSLGQHTIEVIVEDQVGHAWSESKTVTFGEFAPPPGCTSGATTVSSGHIGGPANYLGLEAEAQGGATHVCWHLASAPLVNSSGTLMVVGASIDPTAPQVDSSGAACLSQQAGQVIVSNTNALGTVRISRYSAAGQAWVCVQAPGVSYRLRLTVPAATTPDVLVAPSATPVLPPPPRTWPAEPSARCQASSGTFLINNEVAGRQLWLAASAAAGKAEVCVRQEDVASGSGSGGVVTIAPTNLPGDVGLSDDLGPCTQVVNHFDAPPVRLHIDRSPGADPQSVCVDAGVQRKRLFVGTTGGGNPVAFESDD